jgi:hypothetical protein
MVRLERDLPPELAGRAELSAAEYRALADTPPARNKYGAVPTEIDGRRFDSLAEAARYGELLLRERAGEITGLRVHPRYPLTVEGEQVAVYEADFWYSEGGRPVVEDVKGVRTAAYKLKARLFRALYGLEIREIEA